MSHYDTYWTIRSLAALPEFGGEFIDYNKLNEYTSVWDCNAN